MGAGARAVLLQVEPQKGEGAEAWVELQGWGKKEKTVDGAEGQCECAQDGQSPRWCKEVVGTAPVAPDA